MKILITASMVIDVDPGFEEHLGKGAPWAFRELERRIAEKQIELEKVTVARIITS